MSEERENKDIDCTSSKIDLKLDLSPPVLAQLIITTISNSSTSSPTSSCVSLDEKHPGNDSNNNHDKETTVTSDMVLVGCRNCLMYVLLMKDNLRCPKCKNSDFIDIPDYNTKSNKKSRKN
ncbi:hypothetical protein MKX01_037512 [Papaver californicum]|nr:hypothetical protein MKX01_037512 [Papaver californicum]